MALKHVNAVIVGAGAGGGVVAKELAAAGLSVVLLERGKWYSAADCRKDDLCNQRTQVLGAKFGPDDERNPRVLVDEQGRETVVTPSDGGYSNNAACVGGGTFSYGAMAWRYMEKDFRMRSTYGAVEGSTLEDWPISYADLEPYYEKAEWEMGVSGDDSGNLVQRSAPEAAAHAAASAQPGVPDSPSGRQTAGAASVRHPHAAEHGAVQRPPVMHAMPLVRGFRLRSERPHRHAQYRNPRRAGHRQLRAPHGMHDQGDPAGCSGAGYGAWRTSMPDNRLQQQTADLVIVCGGAVESARLLLNTKHRLFPNGLGNRYDWVGRNLQSHSYSGATGLFDYDTYDDLGPGASIAICDYNHGNPGLAGGAMLANEFIRLPYQFMTQVPPWVPRWGLEHKEFVRNAYRRTIAVMGPVQEMPLFGRARAGGSESQGSTGAFRWRGSPAGDTRTPSKSAGSPRIKPKPG